MVKVQQRARRHGFPGDESLGFSHGDGDAAGAAEAGRDLDRKRGVGALAGPSVLSTAERAGCPILSQSYRERVG